MDRFYRLLAFGYLPKELPPIFHSSVFAKEIKRNYSSIDSFCSNNRSNPCRYLLQQRNRYRRSLSILNPNAMIKIAKEIASNIVIINNLIEESQLSVSKPRFRRKTKFYRAVSSEKIGNQVKEKKLFLRATYPLILKCDIKNYYRSVYTHTIPWAIHGKSYSKQHQRENNLGNILDGLTRLGQDGQTIGLPVGPDTSFILSELLLAAIDKELGYEQTKSIRYYDDYEFGCDSEREADNILDKLELLLSKYELELNHEKTDLIKGPHEIGNSWTYLLKNFTGNKIKSNEDLIDLFNVTSELAKENESDFVFKYFIRRMRMRILEKKHWDTWQNVLFASALSEFGNLREIYEQLDLYKRIGYRLNLNGLRNLLERKAKMELRGGISSELSWILFGFLKFGIKPNRELLLSVIDKGDDISRIIAIKLAIDKKIGIKKKIKELLNLLDSDAPLSEHWLLFWELYVNNWISDPTLKSELLKENIFNFLDSNRISFIRDPQVDLLEIPAPFKEKIEKLKGAQEVRKLLQQIENTFGDLSPEDEGDFDIDEAIDVDSDDNGSEYD